CENPAAMMDPAQSIGRSSTANALRIASEDHIADLHVRRPELAAKTDESRYLEAIHYATMARQLPHYHAALAGQSDQRIAGGLGARDAMMADNLAYNMDRERNRGKVLTFAHNSHLKRGQAQRQLGANLLIRQMSRRAAQRDVWLALRCHRSSDGRFQRNWHRRA